MGDVLAAKLAKRASELFLLTHHKVADDIQGELYENGVDTVAKFAAAATDEADLKKMLKDSFSIDPTESPKLRAQAAGVVVAWKTGKTAISRVKRQAEAEATHEVCVTSLSPSLARTLSLCAKPFPLSLGSWRISTSPLKSSSRRSWES